MGALEVTADNGFDRYAVDAAHMLAPTSPAPTSGSSPKSPTASNASAVRAASPDPRVGHRPALRCITNARSPEQSGMLGL